MSFRTPVEETGWFEKRPEEEVEWVGQPSKEQMYGIIVGGVIIALFGVVFPLKVDLVQNLDTFGAVLAPFGCAVMLWGYLRRELTYYVVTNERVLVKTGVIGNHAGNEYSDIEHVMVNQSPLSNFFSTGEVVMYTSGPRAPDMVFTSCPEPHDVKNRVQAYVNAEKDKGSPAVDPAV